MKLDSQGRIYIWARILSILMKGPFSSGVTESLLEGRGGGGIGGSDLHLGRGGAK